MYKKNPILEMSKAHIDKVTSSALRKGRSIGQKIFDNSVFTEVIPSKVSKVALQAEKIKKLHSITDLAKRKQAREAYKKLTPFQKLHFGDNSHVL